jgi:methionyl-tRNA synthetase
MAVHKAEYILVSVAWPYASAEIHQGNVTGSYLPADIYARFHRLKGNHVLMVSGSDSHGTPVTVKADEEGKTPREVFDHFHGRFLELFQKFGLTYDLFTHTDTENHHKVSQEPPGNPASHRRMQSNMRRRSKNKLSSVCA